MDCGTIHKMLSRYLDGELAEAKAYAVDQHIAGCDACRAELESLRRTLNALDAWPDVEPKFTLSEVKSSAARRRRRWRTLPKLSPVRRLALASGVALSILLGAIGGGWFASTPRLDQTAHDVLTVGIVDEPLANMWITPAGYTPRDQEADL